MTRTKPGFVSRALAFVIDIFVMALGCLLSSQTIALTAQFFGLGSSTFGARLAATASRVAVVLVIILYLPLCWALTGRSIGKALLGLRIVNPRDPWATGLGAGRSFLRFAGYWLSALPLGLGFLWALGEGRHKAFHDKLAGTEVVYQPDRRGRTPPFVAAARGPTA
jgi:uncharacterized RDD family membrane protein YckC